MPDLASRPAPALAVRDLYRSCEICSKTSVQSVERAWLPWWPLSDGAEKSREVLSHVLAGFRTSMATWAEPSRSSPAESSQPVATVASATSHPVSLVALINAITDTMACSVYNTTAVYSNGFAKPESFFHLTLAPDGQSIRVSPLRCSTNFSLELQASIMPRSAFTAGYWGPGAADTAESTPSDRAAATCSRGTVTASEYSEGTQSQSGPEDVVRCVISGPLQWMRGVHDELTSGAHGGYEPFDDGGEVDRGWDPRMRLPGAKSAEPAIRHSGPDDTSFPLVSDVDRDEEEKRAALKAMKSPKVSG